MITAGKPVTGDQLIGRQKEIDTINRYLDMGQSVVLIAPRRYGKTSLLLEKLWEAIAGNRQEKTVILALAVGVESLYSSLDRKQINISRTLKKLTGSGLVTDTSPPALTDPMFRI